MAALAKSLVSVGLSGPIFNLGVDEMIGMAVSLLHAPSTRSGQPVAPVSLVTVGAPGG